MKPLTPAQVAALWDSSPVAILGADVGGTAGFLLGAWRPDERLAALVQAYQCDGASAPGLMRMLMREYRSVLTACSIEWFVSGPRAAKLKNTNPAEIRAQVTTLSAIAGDCGLPVYARTASQIKNWATDQRLERAGVLAVTSGMPKHARDGGRACVYCRTWDCGLPDPLSRKQDRKQATSA